MVHTAFNNADAHDFRILNQFEASMGGLGSRLTGSQVVHGTALGNELQGAVA
jgi:hypothetical protein